MNKAVSTKWVRLAVLVTLVALPTTGWAAERCVLGDYFTATW